MKISILLALCLHLLACGATISQNIKPAIVSSVVLSATQNSELELAKQRLPLAFFSGKTVDNCQEYFQLKGSSELQDGVNNMIAAQDYVICDTLQALKSAVTEFTNSGIKERGAALAQRVALDSFSSSAYQKTDDDKTTPQAVFSSLLTVTENALTMDSGDWFYQLEVVAVADVDKDGHEDWLLWLTDKAKSGNYSIMKAYIIHDVVAPGLWSLSEI